MDVDGSPSLNVSVAPPLTDCMGLVREGRRGHRLFRDRTRQFVPDDTATVAASSSETGPVERDARSRKAHVRVKVHFHATLDR
jgi:hypothetical protein